MGNSRSREGRLAEQRQRHTQAGPVGANMYGAGVRMDASRLRGRSRHDVQAPISTTERRTMPVRNQVNIRQESLRLVSCLSDDSSQSYFLEFAFDAERACTVEVFYNAKEVVSRTGALLEIQGTGTASGSSPIDFPAGLGQKFGADRSRHSFNIRSCPPGCLYFNSASSATCPIVIQISAIVEPEVGNSAVTEGEHPQSQTVFATFLAPPEVDGAHGVKVVAKKIQIAGQNLEIQELYGLQDSSVAVGESGEASESAPTAECVICMSAPPDTAILPCRYVALRAFSCMLLFGAAQAKPGHSRSSQTYLCALSLSTCLPGTVMFNRI